MLFGRAKQSSMDRIPGDNAPNKSKQSYSQPTPVRKTLKGRKEMRGATARGINQILKTGGDLGHVTEIYIFAAAATGNSRELKRLCSLPGANMDAKDERGRTAAHISVEEGQLRSLQTLSELGADMDAREEHGATPGTKAPEFLFP